MNDAASDNGAEPAAAGDGAAPRISLGAGSEAGARSALGKGRALVPVPQPAARADFIGGLGRSHGVVAAGVAVVMGIGFVAGTAAFASKPQTTVLAQQAASQPAPPLVAQAATSVPAPVDATMDALMRVQGEVRALRASLDGLRAAADDGRQADAVRGLRRSVEALKQDLEGVRTASAASAGAVGQLGAKIDRLDRDPGPKLNEIAARLDKIDREAEARAEAKAQDAKAQDVKALDGKGVDARLAQATQAAAQLAARLDRVERQVASADATGAIPSGATATAQAAAAAPSAASPARAPLPPQRAPQAAASSAPAPAPSPTGAIPPARPDVARSEAGRGEAGRAELRPEPKGPEVVARAEALPRPQDAPARPATVDGWLLRDVYGGVALVEGRAGGLREVAPGEYVPGVGEIRSIERRGRGWVVVTSRGLIQADNRW